MIDLQDVVFVTHDGDTGINNFGESSFLLTRGDGAMASVGVGGWWYGNPHHKGDGGTRDGRSYQYPDTRRAGAYNNKGYLEWGNVDDQGRVE